MRYLFDTQVVIWAAYESDRMPVVVRDLLDDDAVVPILSVVTIWEVAIKAAKHRAFPYDPHVLRSAMAGHGWAELPVVADHALAVAGLPPIHNDLFDRLLLAQALAEGVTLITADKAVARYPGRVRLV